MHTDDDIELRISYFDETDQWGAWWGEDLIGSGDTAPAALIDAAKTMTEWAKTSPTVSSPCPYRKAGEECENNACVEC